MEVHLCKFGGCPSVKLDKKGAAIGEKDNIVRLRREEWNELVRLAKEGKLREIK